MSGTTKEGLRFRWKAVTGFIALLAAVGGYVTVPTHEDLPEPLGDAVGVVANLVDPKPAGAETRWTLGGLDFNIYCHDQYSVPIIARYGKADLFGQDITMWRCVVHEWNGQISGIWLGWSLVEIHSIDVDAACRTQYGRGDARASFHDFWNPYSWYCYYPVDYYA